MNRVTAKIFNIQTMSTEDGPGIRTTVFMKGCPLACLWCQNPEGLSMKIHLVHHRLRCIGCGTCRENCPRGALIFTEQGIVFSSDCRTCLTCAKACPANAIRVIGEEITVDDLLARLLQDLPFYRNSGGGVTFSGGECLLQQQFLLDILPRLKEKDVHVCLDTCGYISPEIFREVVPLAQLVLYDLKLFDDEKHRLYTGVSNKLILENACWLGRSGIPVWIRVPIIPGYTDDEENIEALALFIKKNLLAAQRIDLLGYNDICAGDYEKLRMDYPLKDTPRVKESTMMNLRRIMEQSGVKEITVSNFEKGV
ncbi:MAG: glycyl-radical enzyme activating protein [Firmicutes bacterium]|nr:glycyl-radical enzyme activating protein [Bacillota bacterium]